MFICFKDIIAEDLFSYIYMLDDKFYDFDLNDNENSNLSDIIY